MENRQKAPTRLADFKTNPPRVEVTKVPKDDADVAITNALIERYTQPDGFHCPRCGEIFTNAEKAVEHMADEINKALDLIGKQP